jgi:hypothetical protein
LLVDRVTGTANLPDSSKSVWSPRIAAPGVVAGVLQIDAPIGVRERLAWVIDANPIIVNSVSDAVIDFNPVERMIADHIALDGVSNRGDTRGAIPVNVHHDT